MADFASLFVVLALLAVIIVQALERYYYAQLMQQEQARLITAVMSKDVKEYTEAIKTEKQQPFTQPEPDEDQISELDDKDFDKHIQRVIS